MPYGDSFTIVLGADGFLGRNFVEYWRAPAWPVHAVGRDAGDLTDPDAAGAAFAAAPRRATPAGSFTPRPNNAPAPSSASCRANCCATTRAFSTCWKPGGAINRRPS